MKSSFRFFRWLYCLDIVCLIGYHWSGNRPTVMSQRVLLSLTGGWKHPESHSVLSLKTTLTSCVNASIPATIKGCGFNPQSCTWTRDYCLLALHSGFGGELGSHWPLRGKQCSPPSGCDNQQDFEPSTSAGRLTRCSTDADIQIFSYIQFFTGINW